MDKLDSIEIGQILEKHGVTSVKDLDGQLADASVFYRIGRGEASASQLMDALSKIWPQGCDRPHRGTADRLVDAVRIPAIDSIPKQRRRESRERPHQHALH